MSVVKEKLLPVESGHFRLWHVGHSRPQSTILMPFYTVWTWWPNLLWCHPCLNRLLIFDFLKEICHYGCFGIDHMCELGRLGRWIYFMLFIAAVF